MGIPFYFKNLVRTHSGDVIKPISKLQRCDRLFLDFNSIIHQSANLIVNKNPLAPYDKLQTLVINEVMEEIVKVINVMFPTELLFIGIDGTCPRAKMTQQRKRRYISAWRNEKIQTFKKANNLSVTQWDSNIITPGTEFMKALDSELKLFVEKNDKKLGFSILLSPSSEAGEGEHKIMRYIKANHTQCKDVIYGLDADLIMLSLISPNADNIRLLRERPEFNIPLAKNVSDAYLLLDIGELSKSMKAAYNLPDEWDLSQFAKDYVMMCALLGNDFIPPLSYLKIKENGVEMVINAYKKVRAFTGKLLLKENELNYMFLLQLLKELAKFEDEAMKECCDAYYTRRYKPHSSKSSLDSLNNEIDNYPVLNKCRFIINPAQNGWRIQYYWHLFNSRSSSDIISICHNYIQGIIWIYKYYFTDTSYYSWYYKYCYSPTLLELVNALSSCNIADQEAIVAYDPNKDTLMNNEIQLLLVLPPQSMGILTDDIRRIMNDITLGTLHFYPWKFDIPTFMKVYLWECSAHIPDIEVDTLLKAYNSIVSAR